MPKGLRPCQFVSALIFWVLSLIKDFVPLRLRLPIFLWFRHSEGDFVPLCLRLLIFLWFSISNALIVILRTKSEGIYFYCKVFYKILRYAQNDGMELLKTLSHKKYLFFIIRFEVIDFFNQSVENSVKSYTSVVNIYPTRFFDIRYSYDKLF